MLFFCDVEKTQNVVIFLVLTVFGVCGAAILLLLRPIKNEVEEEEKDDEVGGSHLFSIIKINNVDSIPPHAD